MSDTNSVTGNIKLVEEAKEYGANGFRKRMIVVSQGNERYENVIPLYLIQDNCEMADGLEKGMRVTVHFNLKGRMWQKDGESEPRYFLDAEVVDIYSPLDVDEEAPPPDDEPF
jgi:hypothetical protein